MLKLSLNELAKEGERLCLGESSDYANVTSKSFKLPQSRELQRPDSHSSSSHTSISEQQCFLCGYEYPHKGECPAKGKRCSNCGKANHFKKMCKSGSNSNSSSSRSNYSNTRPNHHGTSDRMPNNNFNRYGGSPTRSMLRQVSGVKSVFCKGRHFLKMRLELVCFYYQLRNLL